MGCCQLHLYPPRQKCIFSRDGHPWPEVKIQQLVLGADSEGQAKMQACNKYEESLL